MPWIELHQNILRHPKLVRLSVRLSIKKQDALWHLLSLWLWALDYADNGDLKAFGAAEIAEAAEWRGEPEGFLSALQESRWMDEMSLHDWMDYAGRLVEQREANRKRMRDKRAEHVQRTNDERWSHVGGLPNQTNQPTNQTKPNQPDHRELEADFEKIRLAYPGKRKGFEQEWRAFERKNKKRLQEVLPLVAAGVDRYKAEIASNGTEKRFIKHFSTWLNQECWTEEPAQETGKAGSRQKQQGREYDENLTL